MLNRLTKIISNFKFVEFHGIPLAVEEGHRQLADYLLSEGVIVPPYKPLPLIDEGDQVLCPICETDLMGRYIDYDNIPSIVTCYNCGSWIDSTKAVDREEAEKALERSIEK